MACSTPHGWLMWVPSDLDEPWQGAEERARGVVLAIQRYARALGCAYVLFDADRVADLPTWQW